MRSAKLQKCETTKVRNMTTCRVQNKNAKGNTRIETATAEKGQSCTKKMKMENADAMLDSNMWA